MEGGVLRDLHGVKPSDPQTTTADSYNKRQGNIAVLNITHYVKINHTSAQKARYPSC